MCNICLRYISGMIYAIRSSLYLLLIILDNIVSSDRVSVSSEVLQYVMHMFMLNMLYMVYMLYNICYI